MSIKIQGSKQILFLCWISLNFIALEPTQCEQVTKIGQVSCVHILSTKLCPIMSHVKLMYPKGSA